MAVSWSCLYVGALTLLFTNNEEKATSAGILFSTGSLSAATGPFLEGLWPNYGDTSADVCRLGLSVAGLAIISGYSRVKNKLKDPS